MYTYKSPFNPIKKHANGKLPYTRTAAIFTYILKSQCPSTLVCNLTVESIL